MSASLSQLRGLLAAAPDGPELRRLLGALDEDIAAMGRLCITLAGPDATALAELRQTLDSVLPARANVEAFLPYRAVLDWHTAISTQLMRCTFLIALTTGRQFMPQALFDLVDAACCVQVPVLLLVDGLGRSRDPAALRQALALEVARLFSSAELAVSFLSDRSFPGETLHSALASFMKDIEENIEQIERLRAERLFSNRRCAASVLLRTEEKRLQSERNAMRVAESKAGDYREILVTTADAIVASWSDALYTLIEKFASDERQLSVAQGELRSDQQITTTFAAWCSSTDVVLRRKISDYALQSLNLLSLPVVSDHTDNLWNSFAEIEKAAFDEIDSACRKCIAAIDMSNEHNIENTGGLTNLRRLLRVAEDDRPVWQRPDLTRETFASRTEKWAEEDRQKGEGVRDGVDALIGASANQLFGALYRAKVARAFAKLTSMIVSTRERSAAHLKDCITQWVEVVTESLHTPSTGAWERLERRLSAVQALLGELG
jgi:hypothetical protein